MFNLTDPGIKKAERDGSLDDFSFVGECNNCGKEINSLYGRRYTDKHGNTFCCEECGIEHHDIKLAEV